MLRVLSLRRTVGATVGRTPAAARFFSSDSHDDFAPQKKVEVGGNFFSNCDSK